MARLEWQRGVYLASVIGNPTYRNEMLYKVAESEASGSATIANEASKASDPDSLADRPAAGERNEQAKARDRRRSSASPTSEERRLEETGRRDSGRFVRGRQEDRPPDLEVSRHGADRAVRR